MPWTKIIIESEADRSAIVAILARNDYEVRIKKVKVKTRTERFVEFRERTDDECTQENQ